MKPSEAATEIFSSASKIVFLMVAFTVCAGFFFKLLTQDNFMYVATSVFSFYFGKAQEKLSSLTRIDTSIPSVLTPVNVVVPKQEG